MIRRLPKGVCFTTGSVAICKISPLSPFNFVAQKLSAPQKTPFITSAPFEIIEYTALSVAVSESLFPVRLLKFDFASGLFDTDAEFISQTVENSGSLSKIRTKSLFLRAKSGNILLTLKRN